MQQQPKTVSCVTCFQSGSDAADLLNTQRQDITETLQKYFWFTEAELRQASICPPCWEQISAFHKFYTKVEQFYKDHWPKPVQINVKCEPDDLAAVYHQDGNCSQFEDENELDIKQEEDDKDDESMEPLEVDVQIEDEDETEDEDEQEDKPPRKRARRTVKPKSDDGTPKRHYPMKSKEQREKEDEYIKQHAKYTCEQCGTVSETFRLFQLHAFTVHETKNPFVVCCGNRYYKKVRLYQHVMTLNEPNAFQCQVCNKTYADEEGMKRHAREFHASEEEKKYKCERCDKGFVMEYRYKMHMRDHEDEDSQSCKCDHCGKIYKSRNILKNHIKLHHTEPTDFICDICAKGFHLKSLFLQHKKSHEAPDELKMQCEICLRWLKNRESWRRHMLQHRNGEVTCDICGHVSPHARALQGHKRRQHREQKPEYACSYCPKSFSKPITLREHVAAIHTGDILYSCTFCEKTFNSNANMHSHKKKMHPAEWLEEHNNKFYNK